MRVDEVRAALSGIIEDVEKKLGEQADDAFYVRIDEVLNPFSEQALGRLHIEIGVRPSYPAEFIIVRIGIWQGGSDVTET